MPKHFLYVMVPTAPAPAGTGDMKSWFTFYKWFVEGAVFVPLLERQRKAFENPVVDDYVWFAWEGDTTVKIFGGAKIVHVEEDHQGQEIWYQGDQVIELTEPLDSSVISSSLPEKLGLQLLARAAPVSSDNNNS